MENSQQKRHKIIGFLLRHWVFFAVLAVLLISSFFVRGSSVLMRCGSPEQVEEVRMDYSIYGYLINVRPERANSVDFAKQMHSEMLFMGMDRSVTYMAEQWSAEHQGAFFNFKTKGYTFKSTERRDELIHLLRGLGYTADVFV